jgi:hypothetical protein
MWKVTFLFNCQAFGSMPACGWTETFYVSAATQALAFASATLLAQARAPLLNTFCSIQGIRVTNVATKGVSITQFEQGMLGTFASPAHPQLGAWNALVTGAGPKRQYIMRGITQTAIINENWNAPSGWNALFTTFMQQLTNGNWSLNARNRANPYVGIQSVDSSGNVTLLAPGPSAPSQPVKFFRTRTSNNIPLKKIYTTINFTDSQHFGITPWPNTFGTVMTGRLCLYAQTATPITGGNIIGVRKRNTGRPFFFLRGRAVRRSPIAA